MHVQNLCLKQLLNENMIWNMENSERSDWERSWGDKFSGAEIPVREELWTGVELALEKGAAGRRKGLLLFFQWVAAAAVVLALTLTYVGYQIGVGESQNQTSLQGDNDSKVDSNLPSVSQEENALRPELSVTEEGHIDIEDVVKPDQSTALQAENEIDQKPPNKDENTQSLAFVFDEDKKSKVDNSTKNNVIYLAEDTKISVKENDLPETSLSGQRVVNLLSLQSLSLRTSKIAFGISPEVIFQKIPIFDFKQKKQSTESRFLAGAGLGSGAFGANFSPGSSESAALSADAETDPTSFNFTQVDPSINERNSASIAFSAQASWRFAPRWVLQGGLQYGEYRSEIISNFLIISEDNRALPGFFSNGFVNTATESVVGGNVGSAGQGTFSLTNSFDLISVPAKVGFVIIDKKFNWVVSTGIASDLLLNSSLEDQSGQFEATNTTDFFNTIFLSGLASTQASYAITPQWRLAVEPGYKFAITPLSSSDSPFTSRPKLFSVNIGILYSF